MWQPLQLLQVVTLDYGRYNPRCKCMEDSRGVTDSREMIELFIEQANKSGAIINGWFRVVLFSQMIELV